MTTRSSRVRWVLLSSTGLMLILAIVYIGGARVLSAPRKPAVPALVVVDANGHALGTVAGMSDDLWLMVPVVIVNTSAGEVPFYVFSDHLETGFHASVFFTEPDCNGTPYMELPSLADISLLRWAVVSPGDQKLYVATTTTRQYPLIQSWTDPTTGVCSAISSPFEGVPVAAVVNIYEQYPPPYSIERR